MSVDTLLSALDQTVNTIYWHQDRTGLTATEAITQALDDWLTEQSAEHHRSQPFHVNEIQAEPLFAMLTNLTAAVTALQAARPGLTVSDVLTEALLDWASAETAVHHHGQPFQP